MKRMFAVLLSSSMVLCFSLTAFAVTTLEKINRTGVLTIGTRTGLLGFAFIDKKNEWLSAILRGGRDARLVRESIAACL